MWIRFFAWATVLMVCLISLFQIKHTAGKMEREARGLESKIGSIEQSIEVLEAEWSHLNQPGYIASLANRHLGYDPDIRTRIMHVAELPMRPETPEIVQTPNLAPSLSAGPSFARPNTPASEIGMVPRMKPYGLQNQFRNQNQNSSSSPINNLRTLTEDDPVGALIELYGN
ncbi:MAG: cell division protein FtsL [Alphaproteobacteria bacterium]